MSMATDVLSLTTGLMRAPYTISREDANIAILQAHARILTLLPERNYTAEDIKYFRCTPLNENFRGDDADNTRMIGYILYCDLLDGTWCRALIRLRVQTHDEGE